ncbi:GNAT family N-acetyltransferase [Alteribacter lacisalsi]|uniref:GNAT family N-acetyltransferase n=1 Tax=Alteribacter lacisalsi TaxID=2045244 RepID=A0A2W0HHU1_9BACI|nr:GNAT family N-acetyltransferase [Alteribacter lacisalsi]PYZ97005.1 GNAT family N-acetyltransferase [Alteribacter lacisalsi]
MSIRTERLVLTPCAKDLYHMIKDDYPCGAHIMNYMQDVEEDPELAGWGCWFAFRNGRVIGDLGFKGKPSPLRTVEIGYGFLPEVRNTGYATESARALIGWAFSTGKVDKILAECHKENQSSIRVLEKLGFESFREGDGLIFWQLSGKTGTVLT